MTQPETGTCVVGRGFVPRTELPQLGAHLNWTDPCHEPGIQRMLTESRGLFWMCRPHALAVLAMYDALAIGISPESTSGFGQPPPG